MHIGSKIFLSLLFLTGISTCYAQDLFEEFEHLFKPVKTHQVYKTIDEIRIDGKPDEESWKHAEWSDLFNDIEGDKQAKPFYNTRFKMLWGDSALYILSELEEPHIWAYFDKNDMIVYRENDFEVFIDPDADTHNYFEFEVNARNTLFDLFLERPYRNHMQPDIKWNAAGFKSAVQIEGTLNNPDDIDKKWTVEMKIPFSALSVKNKNAFPQNGSRWKINFSRVNWQTELVDGKYVRKKDPKTDKILPEYNWVWSPQGLINMHYPERWGVACFSTNPVNGEKCTCQASSSDNNGKYLWLLYYKQQEYKRKNRKYATTLSELGLPKKVKTGGQTCSFTLQGSKNEYQATLKVKGQETLLINQNGLFKKM